MMLANFFVLVGLLKFARFLSKLYQAYDRHYRRQPYDLLDRYGGEGTWVLVTGASDGIGAEFCYQLARQGFNLVLIGRTESKLKTVAQKCKDLNAKVETRILVRDFCRTTSMRFYEDIAQQCSDIDVGFVIANAGIYSAQSFDKASNDVNQDMLDANIYHVSALCHKFLPKL